MQRTLSVLATVWSLVVPTCVDLTFCWTEVAHTPEGTALLYRDVGLSGGALMIRNTFDRARLGLQVALHPPVAGWFIFVGAGPEWGGALVGVWLLAASAWGTGVFVQAVREADQSRRLKAREQPNVARTGDA
ncbi:MAG: hypothetical protein AB7K71_22810 [Polyangiaceae bacterium]